MGLVRCEASRQRWKCSDPDVNHVAPGETATIVGQRYTPSFAFFLRTRLPPNFPRNDSSFLILALADALPDIFARARARLAACLLPPAAMRFGTAGHLAQRRRRDTEHGRTEQDPHRPGINIKERRLTWVWLEELRTARSTATRGGGKRNGRSSGHISPTHLVEERVNKLLCFGLFVVHRLML